jgi:hypothetical protein
MLMFVAALNPTNSKPRSHRQSAYSSLPRSRVVVLAEQLLQAKAPALCLYVPTLHATQRPPSGPENPGLQMQALADVLAAGLVVFGAHSMHGELPLTAFQAPCAHALHGPPFGPVVYTKIDCHLHAVALLTAILKNLKKKNVSSYLQLIPGNGWSGPYGSWPQAAGARRGEQCRRLPCQVWLLHFVRPGPMPSPAAVLRRARGTPPRAIEGHCSGSRTDRSTEGVSVSTVTRVLAAPPKQGRAVAGLQWPRVARGWATHVSGPRS